MVDLLAILVAQVSNLATLSSDLVALDPAALDVGARERDLALLASDLVALDLAALERDPGVDAVVVEVVARPPSRCRMT